VRSMGESNAEIVRGLYEAFNRRDAAAAFARISPEVEVDYRGVVLDAEGTYHGYEGLGTLMRTILESFDVESFKIEIEDIAEHGDRVAIALHQRGTGSSSGAPVDIRIGQVWTLAEGKITRWEIYKDRNEAWEALVATGP